MLVVNPQKLDKEAFPSPLFTGSDVHIQRLLPDASDLVASIVYFGKGVRNKWHKHSKDQVLIVTHGRGIVSTEQEEREITVGDIVFIAANEKHWHGATEDSEFAHIYITNRESELTQLE